MVDVHDLQSDRRSRQREERLRALMDQSDCDVLSGQTVPLVPGPRSGEQRVPMYFSNMARGTSESRVSRLAVWPTGMAIRRAGSRSAMCRTVMIAPSLTGWLRRSGWMRPAWLRPIPRLRAYSRPSSNATMLEGTDGSE